MLSLIHGMKLIVILMNIVPEMDLQLLNIEWVEIGKVKFTKEPWFVNSVENTNLKKM
jgi:hypothetical protein